MYEFPSTDTVDQVTFTDIVDDACRSFHPQYCRSNYVHRGCRCCKSWVRVSSTDAVNAVDAVEFPSTNTGDPIS